MNGFLCVNKPKGLSSFDIIRIVRRKLGIQKIGHCGTLDPEATGLLLLAIGNATRLIVYLPIEPKVYEFSVQFGRTTDTLDISGNFTNQRGPIPSKEILSDVIPLITGKIMQKPPLFSAIKIKGKPAYTLARQKNIFDMPEREITIYSLNMLKYNEEKGEAFFHTVCSKGTYIRSLSRDIAKKAHTVGYASSICRTSMGEFNIQNAVTLEDIRKDVNNYIISVNDIFSSCLSYTASSLQLKYISQGSEISVDKSYNNDILFVYNDKRELVAVAENVSGNRYHPKKVFISQ